MDSSILIALITNGVSSAVAITACIIAYRTFNRQKSFENENHYYEYKFNTYVIIFKKLVDYTTFVENEVIETYDKFKEGEIGADALEKSSKKIDAKANILQDELAALVTLIPKKIIDQINKVLDVIYDNALGGEENDDEYAEAQKELQKIADELGILEQAMIDELGLQTIHERLRSRTRKEKQEEK